MNDARWGVPRTEAEGIDCGGQAGGLTVKGGD